ncbi:hypothetical protein G4228_017936 [Cervus hanglu yarkandensis]|nr:hypothetical protein G4228_017936 [Cervus hanglu yarkandensis]
MIGKEEQLKKEQANLYAISRFMKDDASNIHEDSTTEDKSYSLDELHILDMIEQGSTNKVTAEHGGTEEELARRRRLCELHCQCEDFKRQLKTVTLWWQENQMQIKKKDKIIESLNQQVAFGISKMSKLQRQSHAKDNEIKNLKEQLSMKSNLKSLQLKAAVDSWNAIVTDVRNKIAFLRMTRIAWTLPAPVGEAVPPSASLGRDPLVMDWEKVLERLKTAFPQQTRKELTDFVRKLKDTHGKSLSGLTFDEIVHKISQFIDPKRSQSQVKSAPNGNRVSPSHTAPQADAAQPSEPTPRSLGSQGSVTQEGASHLDDEEEEPCVICHENLSPDNLSVLPCAHKFHAQCIRPWLMQQRTCPTCRLHVLLPEEFPGHPSQHLPKI